MTRYFLERHDGVKPATPLEWVQWYEDNDDNCVVGCDRIREAEISTVFLGMDDGQGQEAPRAFETVIFGGVHGHQRWRYSTREEAEAGHLAAIERVIESANTRIVEPPPNFFAIVLRWSHLPSPLPVVGAGSR